MKGSQAKNNKDLLIESEEIKEKITDKSEKIKVGDFINEDERFEKAPSKKKALDKKFKENIKKENKKANFLNKKKIMFGSIKGIFGVNKILRLLDFILNLFSILAIVTSVVITFEYFISGKPYMVGVGCLLIFITIYLNEKIN